MAYHDNVKAFAWVALFFAWHLTAAAQAADPFAPIQERENQFRQQKQLDELRRDQQMQNLKQQQDAARVQQQIDQLRREPDNLRNDPRANTVQPADVDRLQLDLNRLQNEQQLKRLQAEQRILQLEKQGDTPRRQRETTEFTRQQQIERLQQRQKLDDIEEDLRQFRGK